MLREEVSIQLRRILNSAPIMNSNVLTQFLNFVVSETLAGRGETLKEYTIGVQALKKDADFNPQIDSIVRIHAGRLRRALKEYYYEIGQDDPIIIDIPKGSYSPVFTFKTDRDLMALSDQSQEEFPISLDADLPAILAVTIQDKPTIEVLPFKNITTQKEVQFFARGLSEYMSAELAHFRNAKVLIAQARDHSPPAGEPQPHKTVDFTLTGSVQWVTGRIRAWVHLTHFETQEQLWAQTFERHISFENYWEFQEEIVNQVLAEIMGTYGIISHFLVDQVDALKPEERTSYPLHYWYYHFIKNFDLPMLHKARAFYAEAVKNNPSDALAYAYLSYVCSCERPLIHVGFEKGLDDGFAYGQLSLKRDPLCQEAYKALVINQVMREHYKDAAHLLEQGIRINPKSNEYKGFMGATLIYCGFYERGKELLDEAFQRDPYLPWWQVMAFGYYAFNREHYQDAIFWSERIEFNIEKTVLLKAASYAFLENYSMAFEALSLGQIEMPVEKTLDIHHLDTLFTPHTLALQVREGLKKLIQHQTAGVVGTVHLVLLAFLF
jgi:TolB-like protein